MADGNFVVVLFLKWSTSVSLQVITVRNRNILI